MCCWRALAITSGLDPGLIVLRGARVGHEAFDLSQEFLALGLQSRGRGVTGLCGSAGGVGFIIGSHRGTHGWAWLTRPRPCFEGLSYRREVRVHSSSMTGVPPQTISLLLDGASRGDGASQQQLFALVYAELRAIAGAMMRSERADHTLQPTALVHEAFVRLVGGESPRPADKKHFLAVASKVMRQVLVDHARSRGALARGGDRDRVTIGATGGVASAAPVLDLLALDDALAELELLSERKARTVELRYFGGLSNDDIAEVLNVARSTVAEDWAFARAWLGARLKVAEV
jgi:RNA polymerase sigma-70 factor (ECF subfamily)